MQAFLETRGLCKRYGTTLAVDHVSFTIQAGECFALLGPNGAGKTTTLEMLEGLTPTDEGDIRFFGKNLRGRREEILEDIGILMQETHLYKKLTVRETLALFASFFKHPLSVDHVIERLQLTEKADARLETLSGGQKQRAYLGCALINNPKLLFLDEPTTGLDPQARRMIWDLMATWKAEGKSLLLTTHYMEEAEYLADRVAIIDHGRIIAEGSPHNLIRQYCGEQILHFAFEASDDKSLATLSSTLSWFPQVVQRHDYYEIAVPDPIRKTQELFKAVEAANLLLKYCEMRKSTLEDVFLTLTGRSIRDA